MKKSVYNTPRLWALTLTAEDIMNISLDQPYMEEPEWDGIADS